MNAMAFRDTSEAIERVYLEKLKQKTGAQRALMGFSMFETARYLVRTTFSYALTDKDRKIALFDRFYGNDFSQETRDKIIEQLRMRC